MTRNTNTSPLLIYVDPLGGDYNPGLRPSQAVRTVAQAQAIALQYDLTNFPCTIFLSPGIYTDDIAFQETVGGQGITIAGTGAGVIFNCQVSGVDLTSTVTLSGITLLQTSITKPVVTLSNANIVLSNCSLILQPTANSSIFPIVALNGALITLSGTLNITYDGAFSVPGWCYAGSSGSTISAVSLAITSNTGTNFWSSAGAYVAAGGVMDFSGSTQVADTIRGSQWFVEAGATLYIITSLLSLPGDTLGSGSGTIAPRGTVIGGGTTFNAIKFTAPPLINNLARSFIQNQIPNPESLENAAFWTKNSVTSNLTSLDPQQYDLRGFGFPWMDQFREVAANTVHSISQTIPLVGGQTVTLSIVGKRDPTLTRDRIFIRYSNLDASIYVIAIYDLETNIVTFTSAVGVGAVYTASTISSDGVKGRCTLTCQLPNDGNSTIVEFGIADTDTTFSYLGVIANGIYLADASLVLNAAQTGYEYANTGAAQVSFVAANPTSLVVESSIPGTLTPSVSTVTGIIGSYLQSKLTFALTETSGRLVQITAVAFFVTTGNSAHIKLTPSTAGTGNGAVPFVLRAGGVLNYTIEPTTITSIIDGTYSGEVRFTYINTVDGGTTTLVVPFVGDGEVYIQASDLVVYFGGGAPMTLNGNINIGLAPQSGYTFAGCTKATTAKPINLTQFNMTGVAISAWTLTSTTIKGALNPGNSIDPNHAYGLWTHAGTLGSVTTVTLQGNFDGIWTGTMTDTN